MKNGEILDKVSNLAKLLNRCNIVFPAHIAYKIIRNYHILQDLETSINEARNQLIDKLFDPVPLDPGSYRPKPNLERQAREEMDALYNVENEINFCTFSFDEIANTKLTLEDMEAIYFMIKED